jgi:hypothetical protein
MGWRSAFSEGEGQILGGKTLPPPLPHPHQLLKAGMVLDGSPVPLEGLVGPQAPAVVHGLPEDGHGLVPAAQEGEMWAPW